MSRFFATGDTSSESSSSDSEDAIQQKATKPTKKVGFAFSSDEEDDRRVVRSQKDKRYDEVKGHIKVIRNSMKIRDVARAVEGFDNMRKIYDKSKSVMEANGIQSFYIRTLVDLEDFVKELWDDKDVKSKLNKMNAKALSGLRQNLRKYVKDTRFEPKVAAYRANPEEFEDDEEEEPAEPAKDTVDHSAEESESEDVEDVRVPTPTKPTLAAGDGDESDDSIDWISSPSESESSGDDFEPGTKLHHTMFLKKKGDDAEETKKKVKRIREYPKKGRPAEEPGDDEWTVVASTKDPNRTMRKALFPNGVENLELPDLLKKRGEVMALRGKKGTNAGELVVQMRYLLSLVEEKKFGPAVAIKLKLDIALTILDSAPNVDTPIKDDMWKMLVEEIGDLLSSVEENRNVVLDARMSELDENLTDGSKPYRVYGSVLTIVERMDDEYIKILQATDSRSNEYVKSLSDETVVTRFIERAEDIIRRTTDAASTSHELCRILMRRIEHLYFKLERKYYSSTALAKLGCETVPTDQAQDEQDSSKLMSDLTTTIYNSSVVDMNQIRTRAMLCHIYHHALHDRWFQARDLILMSHLQESIQHSDVETQILYNRAMAQLGMCAFRHGMIKDAHDALLDIQSSGRSKELLAQGLMASKDRSAEQEKLERRRLIPFHMHINLELMECVYLTSAMLLEIPYMALTESEGRRRNISKSFYHQLKVHDRQPLIGPPETMREHVVAASNAMKVGSWMKCRDYIISIKAWDLFTNAAAVKEMLTWKIQEDTLRTYVFSFGEVYDTLSLERLSVMFELPESTVHSVISKMIIKEELLASLDEPSRSVAIHHAKPSTLQSITLHLSDKISQLADLNEELMKIKRATPWNTSGPAGGMHQRNQRDNQGSSRRRTGMPRS